MSLGLLGGGVFRWERRERGEVEEGGLIEPELRARSRVGETNPLVGVGEREERSRGETEE